MELIDLENIAHKEKLKLIDYKMKPKARIIDGYIFIDYSQIHTQTEEKCILAEELGHYYYDAYYTMLSSQIDIDRAEYKALKWKSLSCVSPKSILKCFCKGIYNLYDIAEELQVEPNMVDFAYKYYTDNGKLFAEDKMLQASI